eukprot:scpid94884/ scgid16745/ 
MHRPKYTVLGHEVGYIPHHLGVHPLLLLAVVEFDFFGISLTHTLTHGSQSTKTITPSQSTKRRQEQLPTPGRGHSMPVEPLASTYNTSHRSSPSQVTVTKLM